MRRKLTFASAVLIGVAATLGATAPAYGLGAQDPNPNASCMGWLADASNPKARPSGDGFPGLISCVEQIP
jgi:hypothetical protein